MTMKHYKTLPSRPQFAFDLSRIVFIHESNRRQDKDGFVPVTIHFRTGEPTTLTASFTSKEFDSLMVELCRETVK